MCYNLQLKKSLTIKYFYYVESRLYVPILNFITFQRKAKENG